MARDKASGAMLRQGWPALMLLAFVLLVSGLLAVVYPLAATVVTLVWLGALLALCGLFQLVHVWAARGWSGLSWHLAGGAVCLLGGLAVVFDPLLGAVALNLLLAVLLMASGLFRLATALTVRPLPGWGGLAGAGALAVAAGVALALLPGGASVLLPGLLVGVALLVDGGVMMSLALSVRRLA